MTITELANEIGVSKQAITKQIKALGRFSDLEKVGNKFIVPDDVVEQVRQRNENKSATFRQSPTDKVSELAFLKDQIEKKDAQIQALQEALEREQQLHAADKQQLLQLTAEASSRRSFLDLFRRKKHQ